MSSANTASNGSGGAVLRTPKTLVVGLGNPILGDDGIGWRVAEAVQARYSHVEVDCLALGGLSLMERLVGYERAIIIDSIQTPEGQIGQVYRFVLEDLRDLSAGHITAAHDTSLQTALKMGRSMGAKLPDEVHVVGVETERVYDFSEELSSQVEAAIPVAMQAVANVLDSWEVAGVIGD